MKFYQHHIGDFDKATRHLTRVERSIYRDLIELYYDTEQPLTLDRQALLRKIIARTNEEATAVEQVLNEFFNETDDGWYHSRCEEELAKFRAYNSQKAQAGKASAAKRAAAKERALNDRSTTVQRETNGEATEGQLTINHKPLTNNHNKRPMSAYALLVFEHWKKVMDSPRSIFDDKRAKVISARLKQGYTVEALIKAIDGCAKSPWHMGQNDKSTKYNGIELILRDSAKIDQFTAFVDAPPKAIGLSNHTGLKDRKFGNATPEEDLPWMQSPPSA